MNIFLLIIGLSVISLPQSLGASGPTHITNYYNNFKVHPSTITNSNTANASSYSQTTATLLTDYVERAKKAAATAHYHLYEYRYALMAGIATTGCIVVYYTALNARNYVKNQQLWACWKCDLAMAQLLEIPHNELTRELIVEIQRRYTNKQDPCAVMQSIARFLCAIEEEHNNLLFYQKFHAHTQSLRCDTLVLFPTDFKQHIQERLDRLAYYSNIFNTWLAQYNIKNANMLTIN